MAPPYRSNPVGKTSRRPRDTGIVGDIIGQFSDKLAFYRELVQNSMDAETEVIDIEIRYDDGSKMLHVVVSDRGIGMSRSTIENQLVVLFRSTKEGVEGKIGKFGIGFVSVLAVEPSLVRVISSHGGVRHTLHLYPDLSYELFESGRASHTSTQVVLEIPMRASAVQSFVEASSKALHRWCRHAQVMISLEATGPGSKELLRERIDRPLAVEDVVISVKGVSSDGQISAVVGIPTTQTSRSCCFFNQGLLLHETQDHLLEKLSFVVQDARLGHTLSRDNVRRDGYYEQALDFVRELAKEELPERCAREMCNALEEEDFTLYRHRARSVHNCDIDLSSWWLVPLATVEGELAGTSVATVRATGSWATRESSALSKALVRSGVSVLHHAHVGLDKQHLSEHWLADHLPDLRYVEDEMTLATPDVLQPSDHLLLDRLAQILDRSYRPPSKIVLAALEGACSNLLYVSGGSNYKNSKEGEPWIFEASIQGNPFRPFLRPALILNAGLAHVAGARQLAVTEPYLAAEILAREILLKQEKLNVDRSEEMLSEALNRHWRGQD